jgi:hypothetical protein
MTYQIEKLNEARLSDKAAKVYDCLLAHREGLTYPEIAKITGLLERTVCGRMGDLKPLGYVWVEKSDAKTVAYATANDDDIQRNLRLYLKEERQKKYKQLIESLTYFKPEFNKGEVYHLAAIANRLHPNI